MHYCSFGNASRAFLYAGALILGLMIIDTRGVSQTVSERRFQTGIVSVTEEENKTAIPKISPVPGIDRNDPEFWIELVKEWRTAIDRHTPGMADEAASAVGHWEDSYLSGTMILVGALTEKDSGRYLSIVRSRLNGLKKNEAASLLRFDKNRIYILKRGVLLHTDIALLRLEKGTESNKGIIRVGDGLGSFQSKGMHMECSRRLLSLIPSDPLHKEVKRRWYISVIACLLAIRDYALAEDNLEYGLNMFPSDPDLLFYAGALHENYASPIIQNSRDPSGKKFQFDSKKSELKQARKYFQKAIESNPYFYEVHLHLGRIMGLLGDHDEAAGVLQQVYPFSADSRPRYYGSLFLGKELAELNRYEDARIYYKTASAMYPVSQSPLLGLSRLAHIQGNFGSALSRIVNAVELPEDGGAADDPWMFYDVYHVRNASRLISGMYKEFGEQP